MSEIIKASIITIGDELLIGQVIDTNSAWIAQQLNKMGIIVVRRVAVGDQYKGIWRALEEESAHSDLILITGGLGPTADDITKPLLCDYFKGKMVMNQAALDQVTHLFEKVFKRPITERNFKQAEVPDTCSVLINSRGTAPGMWFEKDKKIYVSLPGVPHEMKGLIDEEVIPRLKKQFSTGAISHQTLITYGIGESMLADLLTDFESQLPTHIKLAYLPHYGMVRLRLTGTGSSQNAIDKELHHQFSLLKEVVAEYLIHDKDEPMEKIVSNILMEKKQTLSTAESCTGGYISHLLTCISGISSCYKGSIIAYSNEVKMQQLGVKSDTLLSHGAVSEATVIEMANGLFHQLKTDYVLAVSGIMGPDGGTSEKPTGTVWVAVAGMGKIRKRQYHFRFDRLKNIQLTALNALNLLRELLAEEG